MGWLDRIHGAAPGVERALVYLERAQGRNSKRLCEKDIEDAIAEADISGILYVSGLLERYNLPYSMGGLVKVAARFAKDLEKGTFTAKGPSTEELLEIFETEEPVVGALLDALRACAEGNMLAAAKELMRAIIIDASPSDRPIVGVIDLHLTDDHVVGTVCYLEDDLEVRVPVGEENTTVEERVAAAIKIAVDHAGTGFAEHLEWVIDQMVRALAGDDYLQVVADAKAGEEGPDTFIWREGIAP